MTFRVPQRLAVFAIGALLCTCASARAQTNNAKRSEIPAGPWRIAGTVVNAKTGSPLSRARVTIVDAEIVSRDRVKNLRQQVGTLIERLEHEIENTTP